MGTSNNISEFESRLDWLTLTAFRDEQRRKDFHENFVDLKKQLISEGKERQDIRISNYVGMKIGGIAFVERPTDRHEMIVASGESAPEFAQYAIERNLCGKCTRADGAVTARFKRPNRIYGQCVRRMVRKNDRARKFENQTALDLYEKMHGDSGVTIGDRSAAIYARIYDWALKHQKLFHSSLWRYEIELKQEAAITFWSRYRESRDHAKLTAEMVTTRLKKLGVQEPAFEKLEPCKLAGTRPLTDDDKRLQYIEKVMVPMLMGLDERGKGEELRELFARYHLTDAAGLFLPIRE